MTHFSSSNMIRLLCLCSYVCMCVCLHWSWHFFRWNDVR